MDIKQSQLYPEISASSCGRVFYNSGKEISQHTTRDGYMRVSFYVDGKKKNVMAHRVVASAHRGGYSPGFCVNHINGVKHDNRANNLEWVSLKENAIHAYRLGMMNLPVPKLGEAHYRSTLTEVQVLEIRKRAKSSNTQAALAREFNVSTGTIQKIVSRQRWKHI